MPVSPTYPGIYIQEAASSSHTVTAAPTNIAVFIGYTHPLKTVTQNIAQAVEIFGFSDYQAQFGGFIRSGAFANAFGPDIRSGGFGNPGAFGDMAQAVNQFFLNGGTDAFIVALNNQTLSGLSAPAIWLMQPAAGSPPGNWLTAPSAGAVAPTNAIVFTAREVTDELFAMTLTVRPIQLPPTSPPGDPLADIIITYGPATGSSSSPPGSPPSVPTIASGPGTIVETYRRVSLTPTVNGTPNPNYIVARLGSSTLVAVTVGTGSVSFPPASAPAALLAFPNYLSKNANFYNPSDYTAVLQEDTPLDKVSIFNLMVLPGIADNSATWANDQSGALILSTAIAFCERKRAFLIMDPPVADSADGTVPPAAGTVPSPTPSQSNMIQNTMKQGSLPESKNSGLYFPYLLSPDPITGSATNPVTGLPSQIPPAPTVAGIFAATDLARGVWKAPAGFQAQTKNVTGVVERGRMTDQRQGVLNPLGVNCLRSFPNIPTVVFGSRTLVTLTDEQWRYVPVRRMALFLEQSLYGSLTWVVFEPNADPLWAAITMSVNAFMLGLFKQGAFQGTTPSQAFSVQCNSQTTSQADIDNGIVNIVVAFAPLKPAEFVIITIAQLAGQAQTA